MKLHRSILFWSGLLIIAFLAWAWRDSERQWTIAAKGEFMLNHAWGGLGLDVGVHPPSSSFEFERMSVADGYRHTPEMFPPPFFLRTSDVTEAESDELWTRLMSDQTGQGAPYFTVHEITKLGAEAKSSPGWTLFIPYWLLILLTALLTAAPLLWLARRRKRKLANVELPNDE